MSEPTALEVLKCGAKTRAGGRCKNVAGMRTDHVGQGKCWLHGGATPIRHGRYSKISRPRIRDLIAQHEADPDPLNILPEIAALRALFQDFIERYDDMTEALLAWHASYELQQRPLPEDRIQAFERVITEWEIALREGQEPTDRQTEDLELARKFVQLLRGGGGATKPRTILDLSDAYRVLGEIGRMVERVEKARAANAISRAEMNRVVHEMARVVDLVIGDDEAKAKIREGWLAIAV